MSSELEPATSRPDARPGQILASMLIAARARRRRNAAARAALVAAPVLVLALAVGLMFRGGAGRLSAPPQIAQHEQPSDARQGDPLNHVAQTNDNQAGAPALASRAIEREISDDELVALLRECGAEMGIVRVGHEVKLVPWHPEPEPASGPAGRGLSPEECRSAT